MEESGKSCRLLHHGAAATSSSKAVICIPSENSDNSSEIVYSSHSILNVAHCTQVKFANDVNKHEPVWTVYKTLRTDSRGSTSSNNTVATATAKRVITCVSQLKRRRKRQKSGNDALVLVCGFSDGTITSWYRKNGQWSERILLSSVEAEYDGRAITDIGGLQDDSNEGRLVVVTCTSGGARYFQFQNYSLVTSDYLVHTPANALSFHTIEASETVLVLIGTAAPRHNKIHAFLEEADRKPHYCGALTGHEDWITCFDWLTTASADVLASGSQDAKIRLWKFSTRDTSKTTFESDIPELEQEDNDDDDDDDDDDNREEDMEEGEARLEIIHGNKLASVTLEALLIGHEERVTSVSWHPNPEPVYGQDLILISSSMDRTIFIWSEHESGVWTPISRVGSAGGILGGSVGSSLLGFLNTQVEPIHGRWLLGHGYGGALHFFACETRSVMDEDLKTLTVEERAALCPWRAQPCLTGHFDGVTDLCWEALSGDYLVTVSQDQTCRIWSPLPVSSKESFPEEEEVWIEIARPQVHGYDLSAVTSLSTIEHPHKLVSGADEKELRVFDSTLAFDRLLQLTSKTRSVPPDHDGANKVEQAYIPSLGLSNKATAADGAEQDTTGASETCTRLPLERDLGAMSLWPEVLKLYGHNTELARLTSTVSARTSDTSFESGEYSKDLFLASSAKARDVEAACIRIWDVKGNKCVQVLSGGHRSTVAALSFSPDGKFLASSGKDRRLCIWRRSHATLQTKDEEQSDAFFLAAAVDSAHKRIIWGVHFSPTEPSILATGSRDGSVKIWKIEEKILGEKIESEINLLFRFSPAYRGSNNKAEAVTAVAFAPLSLETHGVLAVGLENGLLELWKVPYKPAADGAIPELIMSFPAEICHIATITKLAWRPSREKLGEGGSLFLASSSVDHGCRIFRISVPIGDLR